MGSVIVLHPGHCYEFVSVPENLTIEAIAKIIDGNVGLAVRFSSQNVLALCDDDGYPKGLPPCWNRPTDGFLIVGPVVFVQYKKIWTQEGPDEIYEPLTETQKSEMADALKVNGWSNLILDELDYTKEFIRDGGKVGEA